MERMGVLDWKMRHRQCGTIGKGGVNRAGAGLAARTAVLTADAPLPIVPAMNGPLTQVGICRGIIR
jgi:hypothetical protein